jgi:threonine/homoserine/homoserine lactone efflux protein
MSISFLITTLVVVATPGTGVVYTLSAGLSRGRRAAVIAAAGCTLGIVPHMAATVTGLATLLHASPAAFRIVQLLGVAYLVHMAVATLRDRDAITVADDGPARPASRVIVSGVLVNLLNPKLTMFFVAFLPQFVDPRQPGSTATMLGLSAVFMVATFVVFAGYGVFAAAMRRHVVTRPRVLAWLRRVFAVSFLGLAAKLALSGRGPV